MKDLIFVVYEDLGLEGKGAPFRAFTTERLATLFVEGSQASGGRYIIRGLEIETPEDFFDPILPQTEPNK